MIKRLIKLSALACFCHLLWAGKNVTFQKGEIITAPRAASTPTRLLFPYVTTAAGFDTEITISNTSLDTSGSTTGAGTCSVAFFGPGAPATGTTISIAAGKQAVFSLLAGGANIAPVAANFSGYMFATCNFPLARGSVKVAAPGNLAFAQDAQIITTPRSTSSPQRFLLPYISNQSGFDSGIAITNTSLDPFGTTPTSGTCTIRFFRGASNPAPSITSIIAAGGIYTTLLSVIAPGFSGYATVDCNFTGAAVTVFNSDAGARNEAYTEVPEPITLPRSTTAQPLLFSYVTNKLGNDTAFAIANTTTDAYGTTPASGACTLNFFGSAAPAPFTTPNIASGTVYAALASLIAPNFEGYMIATCPFALARGYSFVAPAGFANEGDSEGSVELLPASRITTPKPLLFSAVTSWYNADTLFSITNTSQDTLGTSQASGTCTINYFGDMFGGGSVPSPQTSNTIGPGQEFLFTLSGGGGGIAGAPGFRGYIIADCNFPLARGIAWVNLPGPSLSITKTHTGDFTQGQNNNTYTVTVSNGANAGPTNPGIGVTVTETIPSGMTLVSMSGTGWTCPANGKTCTRSDVLLPGTSFPTITVTVNVSPNASNPQVNSISVSGGGSPTASTTDSTTIVPSPVLSSVLNGASLLATGLAPGESMSAFGTGMSNSQSNCTGTFTCNNTSVLINGSAVPLVFVSAGQINFIVPWSISGSTATVQVNNQGVFSAPLTLAVVSAAPGVFTFNSSGTTLGVFLNSSSQTVTIANPVHPGDTVVTFVTGLGPSNPSVADGAVTPGGLFPPALPVVVTVGGIPANTIFVGLAPGQIALYQINFTVPAGLTGLQSFVVSAGGIPSNSVQLPVVLPPTLSITKTHTGNFVVGQPNATYTVTVSNAAGAGATTGQVTVTETAPAGLTLLSMSGTGWTCPANGTTCTRSDALNPGASYPAITVTVAVAANATSPQVNSVSVSGGGSATASTTDSTTIDASSASAPVQMVCQTNVAVTPLLRAESFDDNSGDITLICTGGAPQTVGSRLPQVNLLVSYNTAITSRLLPAAGANSASEALLLVDDPGAGIPSYYGPGVPFGINAGQVLCPTPATGCAEYAQTVLSTGSPQYPAGTPVPVASTSPTAAVAGPNVFQGIVAGNTVAFFGVPILSPVDAGAARIFRITNVRLNSSTLGGGQGATPAVAAISVSGYATLQLSSATPTVGFVQAGLTTSTTAATSLSQCAPQTKTAVSTLTFTENFPTAFKSRIVAQQDTQWAGQSTPGVGVPSQNTPGAIYNSESGFVFPVSANQTAGLSDYGTRLRAVFNNVPVGVRIFVSVNNVVNSTSPVTPPAVIGGTSTATFAQLVTDQTTTDGNGNSSPFFPAVAATSFGPNNGNVPITELPVVNGSATAVWELVNTNPNVNESVKFAVYVVYASNVPNNVPPPGTSSVNLNFAPAPPVFTASAGASASVTLTEPRFIDASVSRNVFFVTLCSASLSITKTHTGNFFAGQTNATYNATVSNAAGNGMTSGTVTVTETAPLGMSLVSMSGTGWTCPQNGTTCTRSDALAPGSSYAPITVTVNVNANATSPQVNQIGVSGGNSASASTTDSTTIVAPPVLSSLSPTNAALNTAFTLTANGSGFQSGASIRVTPPNSGTTSLPANFISAAQLQATVPATLLTTAGTAQVSVLNPDSGSSSSLPLTIGGPSITVGPDFGTWSIGEIQTPLTATGGNGAFVWSVTSGSLPPGLALRTDVPSFFPSGTAAGLIGVATTPGTYSFTLSVTSSGLTTSQACTMKITGFTLKDSFSVPNGFVGANYSYTFTALNAAGPVVWTPTSALPQGMSFVNGVLSGNPQQAGTTTVNFTIFDGVDTLSRSLQITIYGLRFTTSPVLPNATQNQTYSPVLLAAAGGNGNYTFTTTGSLPPGITLAANGTISGVASTGPGLWGFPVTVTDTNNNTATVTFSIDIVGVPPALPAISINNLAYKTATIGQQFSRLAAVNSGGTAPFAWSASGLPPGISVRTYSASARADLVPGHVEVWGTPTALGTFNVQLTVTDANGATATAAFPFTVTPLTVDGADFPPNGTVGVAYSKTLRVIGGSSPYSAAQIDAVNRPLPGGLSVSNGILGGTPTDNGSFVPVIEFNDAANNIVDLIPTILITQPASTITINQGFNLGTATTNVSYSNQLSACCTPTGQFTWSKASGTLPTGINISSGGLLSGTPTVAGTYTFVIKATDSTNANNFGLRQFQLIVTPMNYTGPTTLPFGNVGTTYSQNLLTAVTGATGAVSAAMQIGSLAPPGLSFTNGILSGTPTTTGQFFFTVTYSDSGGHVKYVGFALSIYGAGQFPPVAITTGANFGTWGTGIREQALNATGGNGAFTWSYVSGTMPPGMSVRPDLPSFLTGSGCLCGVITTPGSYSFTLMASSGGNTATQTFTVKVTALRMMDPGLRDAFIGVPYSHTFTATGNAGPVIWTATGVPAGMTLSTAGVLSGTPTNAGNSTITLTLNDGVDTVASWFTATFRAFNLHITSPRQLPNATQYQPYTTTITATGGTAPYTFTSSTLPTGFTLDANTGVLSGTTTSGAGRFSFNVTVTDANHASYTQTPVIDIQGAPLTPIQIEPLNTACAVGSPCSYQVRAVSGGTPPFTWTATGLPAGLAIRFGENNTQGVVPGDLEVYGAAAAAGTYNVQYSVTDGNGKVSTLTAPLFVSALAVDSGDGVVSGTRGVAYSKALRVIGGTGPWTVQQQIPKIPASNLLPAGLTLNGFLISGTPQENGNFFPIFVFHDAGTNSLLYNPTITINNPAGATLSITSPGTRQALTVNSTVNTQFVACCVPSYTWSIVGGTLPPGLTFTSGGLLSGTVTTNGTYLFTVQAADSSNPSNTGQLQYTYFVSPFSFTGSATLPAANVGAFYTQTLPALGGTGTLTFSLADFNTNTGQLFNALPAGMALSSDGTFSGTPLQPGLFTFTVSTTDTANNFIWRTYTIQIFASGENPPLALNFGPTLGPTTPGVVTQQLTASGGTPPYHFSYTPGATVIPGMRVLDGPPLPTSFPATTTGGFAGVIWTPGFYTTSLRVTDGANTTFDRPIWWTVVNSVPLAQSSPPKGTVGTFYSFTFPPYGGSGNFTWTAGNLPPGLTMSAGGTVSGTPTTAGTYSTTVNMIDLTNVAQGIFPTTTVGFTETFTINPFAVTTGGVLPAGVIGQPYAQQLSAPGCVNASGATLVSGSLPSGITLSSNGLLSGTPTAFYNNGFLVQGVCANGTVQKEFSLRIDFNTIQPLFISTSSPFGPNNVNAIVANAISVQGGKPPYTVTLDSGTLPTGVSLTGPGDNLGANLLPGFTYLAGRTMLPGNYSFTLKATDANGITTTKPFTWVVLPISINITSFPITGNPLTYNVPWSQQLLVLGGSGVYNSWQVVSGSLPPGMSLNPVTGVVSGKPTNTGSFTAGIQVIDTLGNTTTQNVSFAVAGATGVVLNAGNSDSYTVQLGFTTFNTFSPSGGTGPYTYSPVTPYPPGCTIEFGAHLVNDGTGATYQLACSPTAAGDFPFTFQINDSAGNIGIRTAIVHVVPFSLFSSTTLPNGSVGAPYTQNLLVWDNTSVVSWSVVAGSALPPGLNIAGNTITGTPNVAGSYSFTLAGQDASGFPVNFTFSLVISTIRITTPEIIPQQVITNLPYTFTMTATGGGTKTWTATGLPSGLTMSTTGTISGTTSTSGTSRITVTVTDGASTYSHVFTLFARFTDPAVPSFAILSTQLADIRVGVSTSFTLSPSGGVPPFTWSFAGGAMPPGLALYSGTSLSQYSSTQTAGLTYIQGAPTTPGSYTFDLIATDSLGTQMRRTFTIKVTTLEILGGTLRTPVTGVAYAQQLNAAGGTSPYTFTFSQSALTTDMFPPGFTASPDGLIFGTTTSTGSFGFRATVQDGLGNTYSTTYSYTVTNPSGLAITNGPLFGSRLGVGTSTTLTTNGSSTYAWSVVAGSLPPGLALVPSASGTLLAGAPQSFGQFSYTLRATDTANPANFADRAYTITIGPMMLLSHRLPPPPGRVGTPYSYTYQLSGGTPPYTFSALSLSPLPAGLSLSSNGVLSGTPTVVGSFSFTYKITDANGFVGYLTPTSMNILGAGAANPMAAQSFALDQASVGVPYPGALVPNGGTAPYTWAVAPGSTLPPGISLFHGSNGVPDYLAGTPTSPGTYDFTLNATDAVGHTSNLLTSLTVSPIGVTPSTFPNGRVGTPYSVSLTPSGGTGSYSFALNTGTSLPPGLSLSANGTLSGTPTSPGLFTINIVVSDGAANSLTTPRIVVIDTATGAAQAIGMPPAMQWSYTLTAPPPAALPINVTATSGTIPFNAAVYGIPGATLTPNSGNAPVTMNLNLNTAGLAAGTYPGVIAVYSPAAVNLYTHTPIILTVTQPPPCTYTLSPTAASAPTLGGTVSFTVNTGALCAWTPTKTDPFITNLTGSGPGTGTVSFTVQNNGTTRSRSANITINTGGGGTQTFTVTQFGINCAYLISPNNVSATASGGSASVGVTTNAGCSWNAASSNGLTVVPPGNGSGNGSVSLNIPANNSTSPRTLTATVANQTFTVNQSGVNCTVGLSASSVQLPASGGTGSVAVTTPQGCTYNTVPGPGWVSITSGDTGNGPGPVALNFSVSPNSTTLPRSGTLNIGGQTYQINQDPTPCSVTVDASALSSPFATAGGFAGINITANGGNCSWTASSGATWATLAPLGGSGNGSIIVTASSNSSSASPRSTNITVAGQTIPISQAGTTCTYNLGSSTASVPFGGGAGSVTVTAPAVCGWSASLDPTAPWLGITSSGSAGTSDVSFTAAPNPNDTPRSGTLTIAGQPYTVTQGAAPCNYVLSGSNTTVASTQTSSSFTFSTAATGCTTTAVSYSNWLTVNTNTSPDGMSGSVDFTAAANTSGSTRMGTIQFGGQTFTVSQTGAACAYSLGSYGILLSKNSASGNVLGSPSALGCTPVVGTDSPSIVTLSPLSGPVSNIFTLPYSIANFNSAVTTTRKMLITLGGQIFTVKQTSW